MQFRDSIPSRVMENENADKFVMVLDGLNEEKSGIINQSLRHSNPLLCTDKKWLIKYLQDYGFNYADVSMDLRSLQLIALNVDSIFRLRGSILGLQLLCNAYTLGVVTVDDSNYDVQPFLLIVPNDTSDDGRLTNSNDDEGLYRYLADDDAFNGARSLGITIYGGIADEVAKNHLQKAVDDFLAFHEGGTININYQPPLNGIETAYHYLMNGSMINVGSHIFKGHTINNLEINEI